MEDYTLPKTERSIRNKEIRAKADAYDNDLSAKANTTLAQEIAKKLADKQVTDTINQAYVNRYKPSMEESYMQSEADADAIFRGIQPSQDGFAQAARLRKDYEPNSFLDEVQDRISKLWDASGIPAGFDRFQNLDMINNQTPEEADRIRKIAEADRFMQQQYPNQ